MINDPFRMPSNRQADAFIEPAVYLLAELAELAAANFGSGAARDICYRASALADAMRELQARPQTAEEGFRQLQERRAK